MSKRVGKVHFHRNGRVTLGRKGDLLGRINFDIIWIFQPEPAYRDIIPKPLGVGRLAVLKARIRGIIDAQRRG